MRKNLIIRALAFLLVALLGAYTAYGTALAEMPIPDGAYIVVSLVNQDPDPAEPGNYVDIRFKFENKGQGAAQDIETELLIEYPFSLDSGVPALKSIGSLYGRQMGDEGIIVKYHVRVDKDAIDGNNEIKLRYRVKGGAWVILAFDVDVQTHELILAVRDIVSEPKEIAPGQAASVDISFENMANSLIKDIRIKLDLGGKPLAPIGSSNEKALLYLEPGEKANMKFSLIAEGSADAGVYQIPLLLNYVDEAGTKYTKNHTIGLIVGSAPDLSIVIDSTTINQGGVNGEATIKFVNKGATDLKFLNVKLKQSDDYIIKSLDEVYVGNIDSDDYESIDFSLFVNPTKKSEIELPLYIEYKDANNKEYSRDLSLQIKLYNSAEAKKLGLKKSNSFVGLAVIVVIVGAGLFFYVRHKRKRKKKA